MAEKKEKNVIKRFLKWIVRRFVEVRQEMKRVIWPTKAKLMQVAVVVLVVILAAAILLSVVGQGTSEILKKVGFYYQVKETTAATTIAATTAAITATPAVTTAATTAATKAS